MFPTCDVSLMNILIKLQAMKRILILILTLLPFFAFSQQQIYFKKSIDPRLYAAYDKAFVDNVAQNDTFLLKRWTFYLDHAFFISESSLSKTEKDEKYPSVVIADLQNINILKLEQEQQLVRDYYSEKIYKIKGTNKYLVYYSGRDFIQKLNEYLSKDNGLKK